MTNENTYICGVSKSGHNNYTVMYIEEVFYYFQ